MSLVGAPEPKAPTLDPNLEEPEEGEITEPNWETALGIVAKALLDNLDPERCKDPAKMCIASRAFNQEWCQNPLFWFALLEKLGWSVCMIVRTTSYEDNPDPERAGFQPAFKRVTTTLEVPTKDTARPPFWTFKQEAFDARLAEYMEASEVWNALVVAQGPVANVDRFDFDWGDYADFWEDNRAAVDAYYRGHRQNLVALLEAHPEERTASLECLREQYRSCCEATEHRGNNPNDPNPMRRRQVPMPIVMRDDQQGAQMLTGHETPRDLLSRPNFRGSVDQATMLAQGFGVLQEDPEDGVWGYGGSNYKYEGLWVDGMRHGQGVETYSREDYGGSLKVVFKGEFKWNARHGRGREEYHRVPYGLFGAPAPGAPPPAEELVQWVQGEWRNGQRHGALEEWTRPTGDPAQAAEVPVDVNGWVEKHVAEYVRGKRTTGTSYWDTGQKQYEGQWATATHHQSSYMNGEGTYYSRSGIKVFTGTFRAGVPHGRGRLFHKDGETPYYDGQWRNGTWHGAGEHSNRNGSLRYDGEFGATPPNQGGNWGGGWNDDRVRETAATGWGLANVARGEQHRGNGWALFEGLRNGTGESYERNGVVTYNGDWKNGKREGFGMSLSVDGDYLEYDGDWKDDKRNGTGKSYFFKFQPGTVDQPVAYEGEWRDNLKWGQGTSYDEEGTIVYQGEWEDGVPYPTVA